MKVSQGWDARTEQICFPWSSVSRYTHTMVEFWWIYTSATFPCPLCGREAKLAPLLEAS